MTSKTKEPEVILISGYKRAGKDTTAQMLKEIFEENQLKVEILSFADTLKNIACIIFDISREQLDEFKNNETSIGTYEKYNDHLGYEFEELTNFRKVLTKIGNEALKPILGEDIWVKDIQKKIAASDADIIIIPDFRFKIEHINKAITVRVVNDDIVNKETHPSETEIEDFSFDVYIDNTGYQLTKETLSYKFTDEFMIHLKNKKTRKTK